MFFLRNSFYVLAVFNLIETNILTTHTCRIVYCVIAHDVLFSPKIQMKKIAGAGVLEQFLNK